MLLKLERLRLSRIRHMRTASNYAAELVAGVLDQQHDPGPDIGQMS
jgi:hypothetical protein